MTNQMYLSCNVQANKILRKIKKLRKFVCNNLQVDKEEKIKDWKVTRITESIWDKFKF